MTRPRQEVVADIERLLVELDRIDRPSDDPDWVVEHWTAVAAFQKLDSDEEGEFVSSGTSVLTKHRIDSIWKLRGLFHDGLRELDLMDEQD